MEARMKMYIGQIVDDDFGPVVVEDLAAGTRQSLRHVVRYSPDGFSWGYNGSGPAELARCILIDLLGMDRIEMVDSLDLRFRMEVIAALPRKRGWRLSEHSVMTWAVNEAHEIGLRLVDDEPGEKLADPNCPAVHTKGVVCPVCGGTP
jgi:hypothetical protein